jgi:hypothetical protein
MTAKSLKSKRKSKIGRATVADRVVNIRIPAALLARIDKLAEESKRTRSNQMHVMLDIMASNGDRLREMELLTEIRAEVSRIEARSPGRRGNRQRDYGSPPGRP